MIQLLSFYLFAFMVIASAVMVIMARNPVHSVLWLILAFFNAAGLMVLLGAEFIAMLLVIVYVGAVAVLFLFVVMMLDIDFAELRAGFVRNFPLGLLVALILFVELFVGLVAYNAGGLVPDSAAAAAQAAGAIDAGGASMSNIEAFGALFYERYLFLFEAAGLILLVAMIGAIVLTHRRRPDAQRSQQDIGRQNRRRPGDATVMKQPKVGEGVAL
ncbi:MAG: NADH:ubiquinone oxidoreductase subunit J [Sphingomonadales bacterium BRH_c42]|nr:MAG: NADH:ubiquinone oxidoreductase subunit J [Sphingomonadales bacterium BRH_c42]